VFPSVFSPRPWLPVFCLFSGSSGWPKTGRPGAQSSDFFGLFDSPVSVACRVDASRSVPFLSPNVEQKSTKPGNETVLSFSSGPLNVALESLGGEAKRAANSASERKLLMISIEVAGAQSEPAWATASILGRVSVFPVSEQIMSKACGRSDAIRLHHLTGNTIFLGGDWRLFSIGRNGLSGGNHWRTSYLSHYPAPGKQKQ
jgi:hypothetical protein